MDVLLTREHGGVRVSEVEDLVSIARHPLGELSCPTVHFGCVFLLAVECTHTRPNARASYHVYGHSCGGSREKCDLQTRRQLLQIAAMALVLCIIMHDRYM